MNNRNITRALHSSAVAEITAAASLAMLDVAWWLMPQVMWKPVSGELLLGGMWGQLLALASAVAVLLVLQWNNKTYNILRSNTSLCVTLFFVISLGMPVATMALTRGTVLSIVLMAATTILFTVYEAPQRRRRVFLLFAITSAAALTDLTLQWYMPVLLIGCIQMRIFSLKTLLAALMGYVTPVWIAVGFGFITLGEIFPARTPGYPIDEISVPSLTLIISAAITVLTGVVFICGNMIKVLAFNARTRSLNGFYTLLFLSTVVFMSFDLQHLTGYLPLLIAMTAWQGALFFATHRGEMSWIGGAGVAVLYILMWAWNIFYTYII